MHREMASSLPTVSRPGSWSHPSMAGQPDNSLIFSDCIARAETNSTDGPSLHHHQPRPLSVTAGVERHSDPSVQFLLESITATDLHNARVMLLDGAFNNHGHQNKTTASNCLSHSQPTKLSRQHHNACFGTGFHQTLTAAQLFRPNLGTTMPTSSFHSDTNVNLDQVTLSENNTVQSHLANIFRSKASDLVNDTLQTRDVPCCRSQPSIQNSASNHFIQPPPDINVAYVIPPAPILRSQGTSMSGASTTGNASTRKHIMSGASPITWLEVDDRSTPTVPIANPISSNCPATSSLNLEALEIDTSKLLAEQQSRLELLRRYAALAGLSSLPGMPQTEHIPAHFSGTSLPPFPSTSITGTTTTPDSQLTTLLQQYKSLQHLQNLQQRELQQKLQRTIQQALVQQAVLQQQMSLLAAACPGVSDTPILPSFSDVISFANTANSLGYPTSQLTRLPSTENEKPLNVKVPQEPSTETDIVKAHQRRQFYKTRLCPHLFSKRRFCRRQATCNYAHTEEELRPSINLTKTKLCQEFVARSCTEPDCPFAHGAKELRSTPTFFKTLICKYWSTGSCPSGACCRHAHGEEERIVAAAASAQVLGQAVTLKEVSSPESLTPTDRSAMSATSPSTSTTTATSDSMAATAGVGASSLSPQIPGVASSFSVPLFLPPMPQVARSNEKKNITSKFIQSIKTMKTVPAKVPSSVVSAVMIEAQQQPPPLLSPCRFLTSEKIKDLDRSANGILQSDDDQSLANNQIQHLEKLLDQMKQQQQLKLRQVQQAKLAERVRQSKSLPVLEQQNEAGPALEPQAKWSQHLVECQKKQEERPNDYENRNQNINTLNLHVSTENLLTPSSESEVRQPGKNRKSDVQEPSKQLEVNLRNELRLEGRICASSGETSRSSIAEDSSLQSNLTLLETATTSSEDHSFSCGNGKILLDVIPQRISSFDSGPPNNASSPRLELLREGSYCC